MEEKTKTAIDEEFIPYEQALELEGLKYTSDVHIKCYGRTDKKTYWTEFEVESNHPSSYHKFISAPTWRQTFKFFRKKFNIEAHVVFKQSEEGGNIIGYSFDVVHPIIGEPLYKGHVMDVYIDWGHQGGYGYKYSSYEEAELACLKKLIELAKNDHRDTK